MESKVAPCHPARLIQARGLCKSCYDKWLKAVNPEYRDRQRKNATEWLKRNPENRKRLNAARRLRELADPLRYEKKREASLESKYGMSLAQYAERLREQNGGCAICHRRPGARPLHVDHDHGTGKVRGLLCHQCNWYLGTIDRQPGIIQNIIQYRGGR